MPTKRNNRTSDNPVALQETFVTAEEAEEEIPEQQEFYQLPARFGSVPVDTAPLGWEQVLRPAKTRVRKFEHVFPRIMLPFQEVSRVPFGHAGKKTEPPNPDERLFPKNCNRLFFGDCLHVMRQLPSSSIDLIYIDPPFFSGRNYNMLFGDANEIRSFVDIWEGGMPGYLVWLNARLYEMKRLLKSTGSIFVHLDWHAVHYVKVEMDKIFGCGRGSGSQKEPGFRNEIVWCYAGGGTPKREYPRKHDMILWYSKGSEWTFNTVYRAYSDGTQQRGRTQVKGKYFEEGLRQEGTPINDWWPDVKRITSPTDPEKIGFPTQKSEELLTRIIWVGSNEGDVVADLFCGG